MTANNWVSLIAVAGWLVLAVGALRAHRVGARKMVTLSLTWLAIFVLVTALFVSAGG
jgi:hypothetical protein